MTDARFRAPCRSLPPFAAALGATGLLPFAAFALGAVSGIDDDRAARFTSGLIAYGAVILAFLGAVQWGFVIGDGEPVATAAITRRERYRLVVGVLPALVGWGALLVQLMLGWPPVAIGILIAGFVATTAAEADLTRRGLVPRGYMLLRWALSVVVVLLLATVLVVRLIGARLTF